MNDANDDYKITKIRLDKIIKNKSSLERINDIVFTANNIVIHIYQFIKLYFLHLYENNDEFPIIDRNFVELIIHIVSIKESNRGRTSKKTKRKLSKLNAFYDEHYLPTIENKEDI